MTMQYALHPLSTLFPRLVGAEFDSLVADIKANGLREPIVLHGGMILDGRNRAAACVAAGVEPQYVGSLAATSLPSFCRRTCIGAIFRQDRRLPSWRARRIGRRRRRSVIRNGATGHHWRLWQTGRLVRRERPHTKARTRWPKPIPSGGESGSRRRYAPGCCRES